MLAEDGVISDLYHIRICASATTLPMTKLRPRITHSDVKVSGTVIAHGQQPDHIVKRLIC